MAPESNTPTAANVPAQTAARAPSGRAVAVPRPAAGEAATVDSSPAGNLNLGFDPAEATATRSGNSLVFTLNDGSSVTINNFFVVGNEALPNLTLPDGTTVASADFFSGSGLDMTTAAGPGAGAGGAGSGSGDYRDDAGNLIDGVGKSPSLGTDYWDRGTEVPEIMRGLELPGGDFAVDAQTDLGAAFAAGVFEDARPMQHMLGDNAPLRAGQIHFSFTPTGTTVVDAVHLDGFDPGTRIFVGDPANGGQEVFPDANGVYTFPPDAFNPSGASGNPGVYIVPPENSDHDMDINVSVDYHAQSSGVGGSASGSFTITVDAVADKPDVMDPGLRIGVDGYSGAMTVDETDKTQKYEDGWAKDTIHKTAGGAPDASEVTLTATFRAALTFGDFRDGSERHFALVEAPSNANIRGGFEAGTWTFKDGTASEGLTYEGTIVIRYVNGVAYDTEADARAHGWTDGGPEKTFLRFEVDNGYLQQHLDPQDPSRAVISVEFKMEGTGGNITGDVSFDLEAGAQAKETPGDGELDPDNNNSYTWTSDGDTGSTVTLDVDTVDSALTLRAGWVAEGNAPDKNLLPGGSQGRDWTGESYENERDNDQKPADASHGNGAPLSISIDGAAPESGEHITGARFTFASDDAILRLNGVEIADGTQVAVGGVTYTFTVSADGGETTVSVALSGPNAGQVTSLDALGLSFAPKNYYEDADIDFRYAVDVEAASGAKAHYEGSSTVVVDAVADLSGAVEAKIGDGTSRTDFDASAATLVTSDETGGRAGDGVRDFHDNKGWETDTYSLDYTGVKYGFTVHVETTFPDVDGSEKHYILVQQPTDATGAVDANWVLGDLTGAGLTPAGVHTAADGTVYWKLEVGDSARGDVAADVPLKYNGSISGDVSLSIKTGSYVEERLKGDTHDPDAAHSGREYDTRNNTAVRTDGTEVTYKVDVINSTLEVKTGWASEGANDAKHLGNTDGAGYHVSGGYAGSTGAAGTVYDGSAPVTLSLSGASGSAETISSVTFTFDASRGVLMLGPGAAGTLTDNHDGTWTLSGVNAAGASVYFKPAAGYDYSDVDLKYEVTVKNAAGSEYTFKGSSQVVIDAVADIPGTLVASNGSQVDYPHMTDPKTGKDVEQTAAKPGDSVAVHGKVTFPDVSGGEDHFILIENGQTKNDAYTLESVTIRAGGQSLTVSDFSGYDTVNHNGVTYYKIPVDNPAFTNGDKIGSFDVDITVKTVGDGTHTNSVGFGGRAEVAGVPSGASGGAAGGSASDNYEFDKGNNEANAVNSVTVKTQGIDTKAGSALGGDTYEHDWARNNLPDPLGSNVAGTATDDNDMTPSGGVNIGLAVTPASGEYVSRVEITLWEPNDANKDGKPDGSLGNANNWHQDSSRGHIIYDGQAYYPGADGKIVLSGFSGNFNPDKVIFVADGHESGKVQLRIDVTVTDSSNGLTGALPTITANVNVDAVATRSGSITTEADFGDGGHEAVATGGVFTMKISTTFFDLDGSENKYVLVEQLPGFTPTGAYTIQYYDLDGTGSKPYFKIRVTDAMLASGREVTDADGHTGVEVTVPVEFKVAAGENLDGYRLGTGTVVEETRIDHNAEAGDYNNVAVRQGPDGSVKVSNAHGGGSSVEVWAYENDRPGMHTGDQTAKGGVDLPVRAAGDANDAIDGQVTVHINPADADKGVFTYNGNPLTFDSDGNCKIAYDPAARLHFTPNDKVYDDHDIKVTLSGNVKDGASGDLSGFSTQVTIKMDAVASLPGVNTKTVTVDYSGVEHDLSKAPDGDDDSQASRVAGRGGVIELNNIQVTFHDFDGSEQHFLLVEAKAGMSVGGRSDWATYEKPVYDGAGKLAGHVTYFKIPLDGEGAIDKAYVHWNDGTATIDHISVTLPENRYAAQGLGKLSYGGMAEDHTSGDAELTFHNNYAANTDGSIDLNWASGDGGKCVRVDGLYENNAPNAHVGDYTQVYGKVNGLDGAAPQDTDFVKITMPRGVLVDSSDPGSAVEYQRNSDGSYTIPRDKFDQVFVKLPENDDLDTDLSAASGGDLRYEFFSDATSGSSWSVTGNPSWLILDIERGQEPTLGGSLEGKWITIDGNEVYAITKGSEKFSDVLNNPALFKLPEGVGDLAYTFHAGSSAPSSLKNVTWKHWTKDAQLLDSGETDVWVDAVAQIPLEVKGGLTTYSNGDKYAETGETVTLHVDATFADIDANVSHSVLVEAKPGWECVDGGGKAYGIVYVDGKAYYSVPVNPDAATGKVSIDVGMKTADPASLVKDANGIAHEDFKIGVMSTDKTAGDGEITLNNNTAVLFPEDATVGVDISPVDSAIRVSVGSGYEDNIGGGDGIPVKLSGLSAHTLEGGGAQETLSDVTFTFKAGAGKLVYDGADCANITPNADGTVTVSIPGFDPAKSLDFVPASNHSAEDVGIKWSCKVTDQLSHDTKTFTGSSSMVVDAVAHAPASVGEDSLAFAGGHDAVAAGGTFTAEFDVTFVNDSGDQKFILVESLPQWALENGANYEKVYPSGSPTAAGGVFYKLPVDPGNLPAGWTVTHNGDTVTVHARVSLIAPSGLSADGSVDIRYGGMTYDPNSAGDGETTLTNNVAYNTDGSMHVDYGMVETTTAKMAAAPGPFGEGDYVPLDFTSDMRAAYNESLTIKVTSVPGTGALYESDGAGGWIKIAGTAPFMLDGSKQYAFKANSDYASGTFSLKYDAIVTDNGSGDSRTVVSNQTAGITINEIAHMPGVPTISNEHFDEGRLLMTLSASYPDTTGETHYFLVNVPAGLHLEGTYEVVSSGDYAGCYKVPVNSSLASPSVEIAFTADPGYDGSATIEAHAASAVGSDMKVSASGALDAGSLDGGFTHFTVHGTANADVIDVHDSTLPVHIDGGAGHDVITGSAHNDVIYGGSGNDTIYGGDGHDTLYGDAGNDIIYGGHGSDVMYGGDGNDTFAWARGDIDAGAVDKIMDFSLGNDKLSFADLFGEAQPTEGNIATLLDSDSLTLKATADNQLQLSVTHDGATQTVDITLTANLSQQQLNLANSDNSAEQAQLLQQMLTNVGG